MAHKNVSKGVHLVMVVFCHLHWIVFATFVTDVASNLSFHSCKLVGDAINLINIYKIYLSSLQFCYL